MTPGNPHAGSYRMPRSILRRPQDVYPGGLARTNGRMMCRYGDDDVTVERGEEIWERVGNHPVSEQAYRGAAQFNKPWARRARAGSMGDNLAQKTKTH